MSISFIPMAGTWTTKYYYEEEDQPSGFYVSEDIQPTVDCHNHGGYVLQRAFGLENPDYTGSVTCDQVQSCLDNFRKTLEDAHDDDYLVKKKERIYQMLFHCLVNRCGFTFG